MLLFFPSVKVRDSGGPGHYPDPSSMPPAITQLFLNLQLSRNTFEILAFAILYYLEAFHME